ERDGRDAPSVRVQRPAQGARAAVHPGRVPRAADADHRGAWPRGAHRAWIARPTDPRGRQGGGGRADAPASAVGPVAPARGGGAGLGLAIVKTVAEAHGGTVTAHSEPGGGTVFDLALPAIAPNGPEDQHRRGRPRVVQPGPG